MANGHGGAREGAGRKTKAETLELDRILMECATEDDIKDMFRVLVKNGKRGNVNAIMAFLAYKYGKPKDKQEHSGEVTINVNYADVAAPASGAGHDQA